MLYTLNLYSDGLWFLSKTGGKKTSKEKTFRQMVTNKLVIAD